MSDEATSRSDLPSPAIDARNSKGFVNQPSGPVHQHFGDVVVTQPLSREELQNRRNLSVMRQAVRKFWIEGVLNKSLYHEALIRLNMAERADAVDNRLWNLIMQQSGEVSQMLPPGTRILDVFDQMEQRLLILGEPGSGKTTTLLELARDLLDRADRDPAQPTPVVFNLSSWAERRGPLADWLVDELRTRYSIPKDMAQEWVKKDELLLLLDGLDEVQEHHRDACAQAINTFRQEHIVPLVVCSRTAEYERLSQRLKLQGAVLLQPLTREQTDAYLDRTGASLSALRAAIQQDGDLREMAQSPLLLSIMTLAYQGASPAEVSALDATHTHRQHLFDTYIARMFHRREVKPLFTPLKTIGWLQWLAQRLVQYGQTTFLIERMQPSWLQPANYKPLPAYALMALWGPVYGLCFGAMQGPIVGLIVGLIEGMRGELGVVLFGGLYHRLTYGLIYGLIGGLILMLIEILSGGFKEIRLVARAGKTLQRLKSSLSLVLISMLSVGLIFGLFGMLVGGLSNELIYRLTVGLILGLIGGLVGALVGALKEIRLARRSSWSWKRLRANAKLGLIFGLMTGLSNGLIFGLIVGLGIDLIFGLIVGLTFGPIVGLISGLIVALAFESTTQAAVSDEVITKVPNQALQDAARSVWRLTLAGGLIGGLIGGPIYGLDGMLIYGLIGGLICGLIGGADVVVKHYLLRLALWLKGDIPRNYVRFLDYAAALIFLRKVGGGYIFVHRLVMEHFAGLSDDDIQRIVSAIPEQPPAKK